MADLDRKRDLVTDKLQKRDEERIAEAQQRKSERDALTAKNETIDFFTSNFAMSKRQIESELEKSQALPKADLVNHFDSVTVLLQKLQKFVSDSAVFLTSREVQNSQAVVSELQNSIQAKRDDLLPKKKFAFRAKKKEQAIEKPKVDKVDDVEKKIVVDISGCNFANRENEELSMSSSETTGHDVALSSLTNCTVKLFGSPSAIHIDKLSNCTVQGGPVSGSIFIDQCTDCTFVLACQQLRIHNTTKTDFYIHVTSKAIIEDCSDVKFAPYSLEYDGIEKDYGVSGLNRSLNNWSDVDDFNWLASDKKSPNWDTVPELERKCAWK